MYSRGIPHPRVNRLPSHHSHPPLHNRSQICPRLDGFFFFFLIIRQPPRPTLFPYTPLSRSVDRRCLAQRHASAGGTGDRNRQQIGLRERLHSVVWRREGCLAQGRNEKPAHSTPISLGEADRKSTRLNSSHLVISYAVFCLKN